MLNYNIRDGDMMTNEQFPPFLRGGRNKHQQTLVAALITCRRRFPNTRYEDEHSHSLFFSKTVLVQPRLFFLLSDVDLAHFFCFSSFFCARACLSSDLPPPPLPHSTQLLHPAFSSFSSSSADPPSNTREEGRRKLDGKSRSRRGGNEQSCVSSAAAFRLLSTKTSSFSSPHSPQRGVGGGLLSPKG